MLMLLWSTCEIRVCMVDWNSGRSDELGVQYTMPCQVLQYRVCNIYNTGGYLDRLGFCCTQNVAYFSATGGYLYRLTFCTQNVSYFSATGGYLDILKCPK